MAKQNTDSFPKDRISVIEINSICFGVDILKSREVIPLPKITPVPNTKEFIVGIFNLRGEIYPLVDISTILGLKPKSINNGDMVIILDGHDLTLGVLVDLIHGVQHLSAVQIKPAHGIVSKKMEEFIVGVIIERSFEIYLLDVDHLFASAELRTYV